MKNHDLQVKPTTIITGFLGAGKTTFLNHLITERSTTRFAIIENEYGEQSIDSELILRGEDDIIELNNGCLCCTLNDNLYDILNTLYNRRDEYDELVIEATGVADPRGLATPFLNNYAVKKQFPLKRIICIVDAEQVEEQLENTEEAIHQITFSDVLLVNKIDLVDEKHLSELNILLKRLNPLAHIIYGSDKSYEPIELAMRNSDLDTEGLKDSASNDQFPVTKVHAHHHHEHTDGVESHTLIFDKPFDYPTLHLRLLSFLTFQSSGLYRMKGLIWVSHSEQQHLLQSVGTRLAIDEKRPWREGEERTSKIVLIGRNFTKRSLEKMFSHCLAKTTEKAYES